MQTLADGHLRKISAGPREAEAELEWFEHLLALRFVGFALEQIKEAPAPWSGSSRKAMWRSRVDSIAYGRTQRNGRDFKRAWSDEADAFIKKALNCESGDGAVDGD
jgi:hypothetical protein